MIEVPLSEANAFFGATIDAYNYYSEIEGFYFGEKIDKKNPPKYFTKDYVLKLM